MHIQEVRNNVFQTNILLTGNYEKRFFEVGKILFFPAHKFFQMFTIFGAFAQPGSRKIDFLLAGNLEKKFSAVEKVLFFPAQKFVQFFIISWIYASLYKV